MPSWLSLKDLALHVAGGILVTTVLTALGTPPLGALVACLVVGLVKEREERDVLGYWSDFRAANHGPANGLLDVATWGLGSALYQLGAILS
jgi:hypothetical protein